MENRIVKQTGVNLTNLDLGSIKSLSEAFKESGLFPDIQKEAQAIVKIVAGQELGLPPVYSMQNFYIIKGRLSMAAETMGLLLKRTGKYNYRVIEHTDDKCSIQFYEDGKEIYLSTFTMSDAKRAGLLKAESGWVKYPRAMLFSRSMSQGSKIVAPELMAKAYTIEEAESITPDTFEEIDKAPQPEPQEKTKGKARGKDKVTEEEEKTEVEESPETKAVVATEQDQSTQDDKVPEGDNQDKELAREQAAIKSLADMYKACYEDFGMQPAAVMAELNVKANNEIVATPWECYRKVAAVR